MVAGRVGTASGTVRTFNCTDFPTQHFFFRRCRSDLAATAQASPHWSGLWCGPALRQVEHAHKEWSVTVTLAAGLAWEGGSLGPCRCGDTQGAEGLGWPRAHTLAGPPRADAPADSNALQLSPVAVRRTRPAPCPSCRSGRGKSEAGLIPVGSAWPCLARFGAAPVRPTARVLSKRASRRDITRRAAVWRGVILPRPPAGCGPRP